MTAALVLAGTLAALCVVIVATPFLREPTPVDDTLEPPAEPERVARAEERDRSLAALKELEFDHRTGKLTDQDYRRLIGGYRQRAATALRALDRRG
jgi:hypothetical protein